MYLVNTPSTKAKKECHSSILYGPFENEKMNERHVATISHPAKSKGGSKQKSMNVIASIFDSTLYQSLKNMEGRSFFFEWMRRVLTTTTIMTMRPLQSTGNDLTD
jgi:hypothetical protein